MEYPCKHPPPLGGARPLTSLLTEQQYSRMHLSGRVAVCVPNTKLTLVLHVRNYSNTDDAIKRWRVDISPITLFPRAHTFGSDKYDSLISKLFALRYRNLWIRDLYLRFLLHSFDRSETIAYILGPTREKEAARISIPNSHDVELT